MAQLIRPKNISELTIITNKAGGLSVHNGIKSGANRIMIPCRDVQHGQAIIEKIINAKAGNLIYL